MTSKLTITDERLAELVAFKPLPGTDINSATRDEWMAMAAELQERRQADSEPVAWAKVGQGEQPLGFTQKRELAYLWRKKGYKALPLYAAPQSAPAVMNENTLRIQGIEALEEFLTATTPEPEMVGGIKLTLTCCRVLKAIIKNNGWADFNGGKPEKVKADTIITALREPHSDACRAAMLAATSQEEKQ